MQFSALFLLLFIFYRTGISENESNGQLISKNELSLLGYIHGYKIGRDTALEYPGFLVSPIILLPAIKLKQNVNVQEENNEKPKQNTSAVDAKILINYYQNKDDKRDIEVNFRQALDRGSDSKKELRQQNNANETLEPSEVMTDKNAEHTTTKNELTTLETTTLEEIGTYDTATELYSTTGSYGFYPNAFYNNQEINSLTITIESPEGVLNPPLADEQWRNFTLITNVSLEEKNIMAAPAHSLNITGYPSVNETDSSIKGVYPAPLYNNAEIDQLSITTNSYTNRSPLPPPQDDRWRGFASLRKMLPSSNEFRPLAGLYYDGFLHRPILKMPVFLPYNHDYLY